jgi:hypothetical protein
LLLLLSFITIIILASHNTQHTHGGVVRHQDYLAGFSERGMSLPRVFSFLQANHQETLADGGHLQRTGFGRVDIWRLYYQKINIFITDHRQQKM